MNAVKPALPMPVSSTMNAVKTSVADTSFLHHECSGNRRRYVGEFLLYVHLSFI
jgi:hypothetical protein